MLTNADDVQNLFYNYGVSPFDQKGTKGLAYNDVPHTLSVAMIYDLPFGKGRRWLNGGGLINHLVGGWRVSNVLRFSSGNPFFFVADDCDNIPDQFALSCIPGVLPGKSPFAQSKSNFDPSKPLFDVTAFESDDSFTGAYHGSGARITNFRGFGYKNHDFALSKDVRITERVSFQFRAEAFNLWNNHRLSGFDIDISSPDFGKWGTVSNPRNIQLAGRITF
jgi:hypothetical protein